MYKVGICGHFAERQNLLNGQTIKTKILTEELRKLFGSRLVETVDTHAWKKNPIMLLIRCYQLIKESENIIILPAQNGVKVFVPIFWVLNKVFHKNLHYVVIGGWLPELLNKSNKLRNKLKHFKGIYVETYTMVEALREQGLTNIKYLPNFKRLEILEESALVYPKGEPYKLCTFSRVMKEKGIEDAIEAVKYINGIVGKNIYELDIYGQVDEKYKERFKEIESEFPEYISYKGVVKANESVEVLKHYYALLFPTYYEGEGFAGTLLDAMAAGLPVISSDWKYNAEVINNNVEGIIFKTRDIQQLVKILEEVYNKPEEIIKMKINCLEKAKEYHPDKIIKDFIKDIQ